MYNQKKGYWKATINGAKTIIGIDLTVKCENKSLHNFIKKEFNKGLYKIITNDFKGSYLFKNKIITL